MMGRSGRPITWGEEEEEAVVVAKIQRRVALQGSLAAANPKYDTAVGNRVTSREIAR